MTDGNDTASLADLERLAARLALLASADGEADNAGRAVGALARRLGLSGGDLKRIFLAGATTGPERGPLERELADLRRSVLRRDADARHAMWERDLLRAENRKLQASLDNLRAGRRAWRLAWLGTVLALAVAGVVALQGGPARPVPPPAAGAAAHDAMVRPGGALLLRQPERDGPALAVLGHGQRLLVRRLLWNSLFQWAEVELPDGTAGYVLTTELDLP